MNSKTIFITGASSGIGRITTRHFHENGWNVAATMRTPEKGADMEQMENVAVLRLDVTMPDAIEKAVNLAIEKFGKIDVLLNNAGYAVIGPFEGIEPESLKSQFDTNVLGLMNVTRALLPHFRKNRDGVIINVSSMAGRVALPLYSPYHGSKWAVEGFSESLQFELKPFNIKVKIIEPGPIDTDFYDRSMDKTAPEKGSPYADYARRVFNEMEKSTEEMIEPPEAAAKTIYKAATDGSWKLRYPAGKVAGLYLLLRKILPEWLFTKVVEWNLKL